MIMKRIILIFLVLLMTLTISFSINGENSNIFDFAKIKEQHRTLSSAVGISVNSNHEIALGFSDGYINVYGSDGKYKYGYSFNLNGSYVFEYDDLSNIMIFPIRADGYYRFNDEGVLIETRKFTDEVEKEKYYRSLENKKVASINGNTYALRQSFGYTELTKTDEKGNRTVIYDIGSDYAGKVLISVLVISFVIVCILTIVKSAPKTK